MLIYKKTLKEKSKMKKIAIVLVVLAIVASAVFAQSASEQSSNSLTNISFWYSPAIVEAGSPPDDWFVYDVLKNDLGIDLELSALAGSKDDQASKLLAAGAANNLPDMMYTSRETMVKLAEQGLLAPVDDMFAMMPDRTAKLYTEGGKAFCTVDGHVYGLAAKGGIVKRNEGVMVRKDWLDKLGLEVPVTLDDFKNIMRAFTYNDPDGNGKDDTYGYGCFIEITSTEEGLGRRVDPFFGAFGCAGTWDLSKESAGLNILKPEYYDAMQYIVSLQKEGIIDPNWLSYKKDEWKASWKAGRSGLMREQNASYASKSNYAPFDKNFPDGQWIVIDPPKGPEGKSAVGVYTDTNNAVVCVSAKAAKAGKIAKIAELLEWMSGDGYYMIGWGKEGENFILKDGIPSVEGLPDPSKAFNEAAQQPMQQLKGLAFYWSDAELQARYPGYITEVSKKYMSAYDTLLEMASKPWIAQAGVELLPLPNSDLKRYYEQSLAEFASGNKELTPETWAKFIAEFKALGGQEWNDAGVAKATELGILN